VTTRPIKEADAGAVAKLSGELGYPSGAAAVRRRFRAINPDDLLIAAVNDADEPIGFIHATRIRTLETDMRVHIVGLVVSAAARRTGVARQLIAEAERWAAESEAAAIVVRSNTARSAPHDFYPAVGYTKVKTQAVYLKKLRE
jgi:predicted N-acetyltransferase YhbS